MATFSSQNSSGRIQSAPKHQRRHRPSAAIVEPLPGRVMLSATALFTSAAGELRVTGDDSDNVITISRTAGGAILVNNGAIAIQGGTPTIANTTHLHIVAAGGNDVITLDETNGALPGAAMFGGTGNDTITGGSGIDFVDGDAGNDVIHLGAGDDSFQWNPGDGSDIVDGQAGNDSMVFNGSDVAEQFAISDAGAGAPFHHVSLTRDVGGVAMELAGFESIDLNTFGGADTITVNDLTGTDLVVLNLDLDSAAHTGVGDNAADSVIINGTNGDDGVQIASAGTRIAVGGLFPFVNITGEDGLDALSANTLGGNDVVDAANLAATNASQLIKLIETGGAGNDTLLGSQGFDNFTWNPGDGSDVIDGLDGEDTMTVNGSAAAERFDLSANGGRVGLTRDVGGALLDLGGIETIAVNALGGADVATVNDLTGTPVTRINLNLSGATGGTTGDGQVDTITVNGTNAADVIPVLGNLVGANSGTVVVDGGADVIGGLPYFTVITSTEGNLDVLALNGRGGNDVLDGSGLFETDATRLIKLTENGGAGNDSLNGSLASDTFVWSAGDGNDTVEGHSGTDTFNFDGSNLGENIAVSANFSSVRITDDVGNVAIQLDRIEQLAVSARGGTDNVVINDLTGTAMTQVKVVNLADAQPDNVTLNGSNNADAIAIDGSFANGVTVSGLIAEIRITGAVGPTDGLLVNALGGADTIDASALEAGAVSLSLDGGIGNDVLIASQGNDIVNGGAGTDTINVPGVASPGFTSIVGSGGDDTVNVGTGGGGFADVVFGASQRIGALNIGSGGVATLTPNGATGLTVTSLNLTGTGRLDLMDNDLIVDYTGASPIGVIRSKLSTGRNGGAWNGAGIVTGLGNAATFALGYAEASDVAPGGTFAGHAVDGSAVVVTFTLYGDANLDGNVDLTDFTFLATNFNQTSRTWRQGDFDYNGTADLSDFTFLAANFNRTAPAPRPLATAPRASSIATNDSDEPGIVDMIISS